MSLLFDENEAPVTVLMYHAIGDPGTVRAADPHYTVTQRAFLEQVRLVVCSGLRASSVQAILATGARDWRVGFTFDDGHESNASAAESIAIIGHSADFFVNPENVGRPGFLDWAALREMARAGHSIQSHGWSHRHLDTLSDEDIRHELVDSKACIEDRIGKPVSLYAAPGGRLPARGIELALDAGYRAVCGSRAGTWTRESRPQIPRLAVTAATAMPRFSRWIRQDEVELARMQLRYAMLLGAKRVLGGRGYERVRQVFLRASPSPNRDSSR